MSPLEAEEATLGDRGIVMVDTEDPLCAAATLFSMEDYTIIALTEPALFHQLLEKTARQIHERTEQVSRLLPGRLWRIYGPEYATPPYLPPRLFEEYVVRYVQTDGTHDPGSRWIRPHPLARAAQRRAGPHRGMGAGRPGPDRTAAAGRCGTELRQTAIRPAARAVRKSRDRRHRATIADRFEQKVQQALDEGTAGEGRGFVLMPSAAPYGRTISSTTMRNYETMVRLAEAW